MATSRKNPFTPTFGSVPFAFAGRDALIDDVVSGLANQPGDPNRSTIFIGPRGSGKTALLATIRREAAGLGWIPVSVSAREGMLDRIVRTARRNAAHLLVEGTDSDLTSITVGPVGIGRAVHRPEMPWWQELTDIVEALNDQGSGLLITVDEVDPTCAELIELVDTYQRFVTEERDVALLLAGLPSRISALLLDEHVSFIRRAFQRHLEPIGSQDVADAMLATIEANGKRIAPDALERAAEATQGFAFAIQLVGYYLWRLAPDAEEFGMADVERAIQRAAREMEESVIIPTLRELRPREIQYLRAMAQDDGASSTGEVAKRMGIGMTNASNLRRRLIEHGAIRELRMGWVGFEMPLLREYLLEHGEEAGIRF